MRSPRYSWGTDLRSERNWNAAEREFNRALRWSPTTALLMRSRSLSQFMGRRAEALAEIPKQRVGSLVRSSAMDRIKEPILSSADTKFGLSKTQGVVSSDEWTEH